MTDSEKLLRPNNRPGLPALTYRIGDYASFKARLLSCLNTPLVTVEQPEGVSLATLTTRANDDPAIALFDACAIVADVLTFYQERIINEGYLLTATERRSVLELARMIGYELNPGVAASTVLAFTVDEAPGSPTSAVIPKQTPIHSIPGQDELPQTFETAEDFIARLDWNALKPRSAKPQTIAATLPTANATTPLATALPTHELYLAGTTTQLQAGDWVLLLEQDEQDGIYLLTLDTVEAKSEAGYTVVTWKQQIPTEIKKPIVHPTLLAFRQKASFFGRNAPQWEDQPDDVKRKAATQSGTLIQGGAYITTDDGRTLQPISTGLPNQDIRCLAIGKMGNLFAGTPSGIFRSKDKGAIWAAVTTGLSNLNVQTIAVDEKGTLLAGTAEGGIFRSKDEGESWTPIHIGTVQVIGQGSSDVQAVSTGLPNTVVRSLLTRKIARTNLAATGKISSKELRVRGFNTEFTRELEVGGLITVAGQSSKRIVTIDSDTSLTINEAFTSQNLDPETPFIASGIRRNLVIDFRTTQAGTIFSEGTIVTGKGTNFLVLQSTTERTIAAMGQVKRIKDIFSDTLLTLDDTPFTKPSLPPGTTFSLSDSVTRNYIFAGTDDGIFLSVNEGKNWVFKGLRTVAVRSLLAVDDGSNRAILAGTDRGILQSLNDGESWSALSQGLTEDAQDVYVVQTINGTRFAGTKQGVFKLNTSSNTWELDLTTKTVRALIGYPRGNQHDIFAATDGGVFQYEAGNPTTARQLTTWGATAFTLQTQPIALTIGTRFIGVVPVEGASTEATTNPATNANPSAPVKQQEWFDFQIQPNELDLETLYPKILADSWVVLIDGDRVAARNVAQTKTVPLANFGLTSTVTRIIPETPVIPADFNRRTTTVLAQSEVLKLAGEPLTIQTQQSKIFLDPIRDNEVFLSQYVIGLQPQQWVVISGKHIRAKLNRVGGVFRTASVLDPWQQLSTGLANTDVTSLVTTIKPLQGEIARDRTAIQGTLYAGTDGGGVFRSTDNGQTWEPINQGLTKLDVQALAVQTDTGALFAITTEDIFYASDAVHWQPFNANRTPLSLQTPSSAANNDRPAIALSGKITDLLKSSRIWSQTTLDNIEVQALTILPNGDLFVGTVHDGVLRSIDGGLSWQPIETGLSNPNATALVSYSKPGTGTITTSGTTVIGQGTRFQTDLASSDSTIIIRGQSYRVVKVLTDNSLILDRSLDADLTVPTSFQLNRVLVGTAGSGIVRLQSIQDNNGRRLAWESIQTNPTDLNIRCLTVDRSTLRLYAGTVSGGVFYSVDDGDGWSAALTGMTSIDPTLNPAKKVNTDVRAIAVFANYLFAAGVGTLNSIDQLATAPIRSGDRLQVLAPPQPLPPSEPEKEQKAAIQSALNPNQTTSLQANLEQKWLLQDRNGFVGIVITTQPDDISLEPAAPEDAVISEQAIIQAPPDDQQQPVLKFTAPIQNSYDPATVSILANVLQATHGETVANEVLGSGDGTVTHQSFVLQNPPLTFVSAVTPSGAESTLQVRINDVLWQNVPSLEQQPPEAQVYITRIADDGKVTITFGDGKSGARLPSGEENVIATYRSGIGLDGNLSADTLSLLSQRPLGITRVNNPLPATGAANPETMAEAKESAPRTVRTLDRIVSLQDYEDFARAFAGIGKAQAVALWKAELQLVHITVAAIDGTAVQPGTALYDHLVKAIDDARDPVQQVQVDSYESLLFNLEAKLLVDPAYLKEKVLAEVQQALRQRFTFEQRHFGQAVTASEAIAVIQAVKGVIAVDLDALYRRDRTRTLEQQLQALTARWDREQNQLSPAQLLSINLAGIRLSVEAAL